MAIIFLIHFLDSRAKIPVCCFFEKIKTPKSHSEIIWPLVTTNLTIGPKLDLVLKVFWFQQNGVTFVLDSKILGRLLKDVRGLHGYTISTTAFCCWSQLKCFRSFSSLFFCQFFRVTGYLWQFWYGVLSYRERIIRWIFG